MNRNTSHGHVHSPDILIIAPWLQGGGGQGALEGILREVPRDRMRLVVLFDNNRDTDSVTSLVRDAVFLQHSRTPVGIARAARDLARMLRPGMTAYSLMRASHLVLGLVPKRRLDDIRFAATFHQLPSQDSKGALGRVEDVLVRRFVRRADLVTAPSRRAVAEVVSHRFAPEAVVRFEANTISYSTTQRASPRPHSLNRLRLLFAGRLSEQKGLDRIPEWLASTSVPVDLRVAGAGEMEAVVRGWQTHGLASNTVEYVGYVGDLTPHLDWCDAVIMPSRWELNPLVVWEAWSRGRPVIASALPVFSDLSSEGPLVTIPSAKHFDLQLRDEILPPLRREAHALKAHHAIERARSERRYLARFLVTPPEGADPPRV